MMPGSKGHPERKDTTKMAATVTSALCICLLSISTQAAVIFEGRVEGDEEKEAQALESGTGDIVKMNM
jgi:hypothetical protein